MAIGERGGERKGVKKGGCMWRSCTYANIVFFYYAYTTVTVLVCITLSCYL